MSHNLSLTWNAPASAPSCGYRVQYRRSGQPSYTTTTSLLPSLTVSNVTYGCYEGNISSNCCSGDYSTPVPFGVNAYNEITISSADGPGDTVEITITPAQWLSYQTYVTGTVTISTSPAEVISFNQILASGLSNTVFTLQDPGGGDYILPPGAIVSSIVITGITEHFGTILGSIQNLDPIATPLYSQPYYDTIPVWNGSPLSLPSFILSDFTPDGNGGGVLDFQFILSSINVSIPNVTINIVDSSLSPNQIIGTAIVPMTTLGLNSFSVTVTASPGGESIGPSSAVEVHAINPLSGTQLDLKKLCVIL